MKYTKVQIKLINIISIMFICFMCLGIGKLDNNNEIEKGTIYKNIKIEGIDISKMSKKEAYRKVSKIYAPQIIKINYENLSWEITPEDISLNYNVQNSVNEAFEYTRGNNNIENIKKKFNLYKGNTHEIKLKATYDEIKLSEKIQAIANDVNVKVEEATINIEDSGYIKRTESKNGKSVDCIQVKEEIYNMINEKKIKNMELLVNTIYPKMSTEDVNSINTVLGQFTTTFNHTTSRGHNINVAANSTSNKVIMPNDEFSYNNSTGYRSWHNGYKTAKVIIGGKYINGEGGGVCQVSTTIYNATLLAGLDITEVHNHTLPSRYVSKGRDAAVSYGYTDLKFKNQFEHPIYIKNIVKNGVITSRIYGNKDDKINIEIIMKYSSNKDYSIVKTYRIKRNSKGDKIKEELISTSKYKK